MLESYNGTIGTTDPGDVSDGNGDSGTITISDTVSANLAVNPTQETYTGSSDNTIKVYFTGTVDGDSYNDYLIGTGTLDYNVSNPTPLDSVTTSSLTVAGQTVDIETYVSQNYISVSGRSVSSWSGQQASSKVVPRLTRSRSPGMESLPVMSSASRWPTRRRPATDMRSSGRTTINFRDTK
jgi:hypothetical protein